MKFGRALDHEAQALPGHLRVFVSYKLLKKTIKRSLAAEGDGSNAHDQALLEVLRADVERLNNFFIGQEEDALIKIEALAQALQQVQGCVETLRSGKPAQQPRVTMPHATACAEASGATQPSTNQQKRQGEACASQQQQMQTTVAHTPSKTQHPLNKPGSCCRARLLEIKQQLVDFHGQMVMLTHWSSLNYNGVAKILKKYDKHTKGNVKSMYMGLLQHQPFIQTERISEFARRADALAQQAAALSAAVSPASPGEQRAEQPEMARLVVRALDTWRHLATSASTPSTIILAPSLGGHRVPGVEGGQPANTAEQEPAVSGAAHVRSPRGNHLSPVRVIAKQRARGCATSLKQTSCSSKLSHC